MTWLRHKSKKAQRPRRESALRWAQPILDVLNTEARRGSRKRVTEILRDIQKLESMGAELRRHRREDVVRIGARDSPFRTFTATDEGIEAMMAFNRESREILPRLNDQLMRSRWSLKLVFDGDKKLVRVQELHTKSEGARSVESAIYWLLNHYVPTGDTSKFRTCGECGKWFFAVTDHQKYCSENCRLRCISHSDRFKEKRRQYMKRYRGQEKQRDENAQRQAKGR